MLHNLVLSLIAFIIVVVDGSSSQSSRPHAHMLLSVQSFRDRLPRFRTCGGAAANSNRRISTVDAASGSLRIVKTYNPGGAPIESARSYH